MRWRIPSAVAMFLYCLAAVAAAQQATSNPTADQARQPADASPHQAPKIVELELLLATWSDSAPEQQAKIDLFGPSDEVSAKIQALERAGQLAVSRRIRLSTIAGAMAQVQLGERRPQVTSVNALGGRGGTQRAVQMISLGTMVQVEARVQENEKLIVDLQVERTDIDRLNAGPVLSENDAGEKIRAEGLTTLQIKSTVALTSGQTIVVSGASGNAAHDVILLTATLQK